MRNTEYGKPLFSCFLTPSHESSSYRPGFLHQQEWTDWGARAVWNIPSVRANDDHEARFPIELPCCVIRLLTAPGETVLDPFMGSGTTALAAIETGRSYAGVGLQASYADMANARCEKAKAQKAFLEDQSENINGHSLVAGAQLTLVVAQE